MPISTDAEHIAISKSKGIKIDWKDNHHSEYGLNYLRDKCPCATCTGAHGTPPRQPEANDPFPMYKPRLTMLGALVGIVVFSNILVLNLGYDLPVKLYSLHVLLMCLFLVLPDARRLMNFFLLNRSVAPYPDTALFNRRRLNFAALVAQLMMGGFLVSSHLYRTYAYEKRNFGMASRPPLYGIWIVDEFVLAGRMLPPLLTDETRWQRMVFEFPKKVRIQSMNGSWTGYELGEDTLKKTLTMQKLNDPGKEFEFTYSSPAPQSLILQGIGGGNEIRVNLHRLDERQFALLARGLHWIDEDADLVMDEEHVCDRIKLADRAPAER